MSSDKGGISATRLSQMIGVTWRSAQRMLRNLRTAMGDRYEMYRLRGLVEVDDVIIKRAAEGERATVGKKPVQLAVKRHDKGAEFLAAKVIKQIYLQKVQNSYSA